MSSDCLNVADDGPDVPRRRFQIDKAVPDPLRNGERIRIAYVPISGRVLEDRVGRGPAADLNPG
ncbi:MULTISPECIES: hypothetical protein [unclassified Burkholderia]|uniref:hypothetical protein n=1 Tax=unclassified Burkholderia TaxID=2613784 RepID=UPI0014220BC5|nr:MULTISPECIES: hypothetical protein [unclassified Burkholderia]NIE57720.1 hypothetical protein [Burkholderia sp. Ap-955]NIF14534.1 hypothetical protein [Burkholderia sp. Ax-1735]NIG06492.1 hypothetical protein [Burkholderia sp. Tr-849]